MKNENGVEFYTIGLATISVPFVHGLCDCGHCVRCHRRDGFDTYRCELIDRAIICKQDLDKRHPECPVHLDELPF